LTPFVFAIKLVYKSQRFSNVASHSTISTRYFTHKSRYLSFS